MTESIPSLRRRSRPTRIGGGRIVTGVLLAGVCLIAFVLVALPLLLGAQSYTVLTGSMRPALEPGHLIAVRETPIDRIMVGDVVTYQLHSGAPEVVTHRVVGVGSDGDGERVLVTQGDANNVADAEPVREVQVRGVMLYGVPWLGMINIWATPAIKSVVVTGVGVASIAWGLVVLVRDRRERRSRPIVSGSASAVAALVLAMVPLGAETASAQTPEDPLELSSDGATWSSDPTLTLIDGTDIMAPGGAVTAMLWVRNAADEDARFTVTARWHPVDQDAPADIALASTLAVPDTRTRPLDAGGTMEMEMSIALPDAAGNETRRGSAELEVTVTLTETTGAGEVPSEDQPGLGATGGNLSIAAIALGGALLALGFVVRRRRPTGSNPLPSLPEEG